MKDMINAALPIEVVSDIQLREMPRTSLNRICNLVDWHAGNPLTQMIRELRDDVTIHRKSWEYALCILGLQTLGVVNENARAISIGAGSERPLYYFANKIAEMVATDLYDNPEHEGTPKMLTNPEIFACFPYRQDHLRVLRMPGHDLDFPDSAFDFAFTLSSIEHFGSRATQRKALEEIRRVVKPSGIVCVATELILNDAKHREYFSYPELKEMFLDAPGLELVGGDLDLRIAESLMRYPIMLGQTQYLRVAPHITLYENGVLWTSVMLFLRKTAA